MNLHFTHVLLYYDRNHKMGFDTFRRVVVAYSAVMNAVAAPVVDGVVAAVEAALRTVGQVSFVVSLNGVARPALMCSKY